MGKAWQRICAALHHWWGGKFIAPRDYATPYEGPTIGYYRKYWTSRLAHKILGFLGREWKWVAGFAVAVAGLVFAAVR